MSSFLPLWAGAFPLAVGLMAAVWVASLATRDASLVDRFWGLGFVAIAWHTWWRAGHGDASPWFPWLVLGAVTIWGIRLSLHITWRNWGRGEDPRYRAMREAGGPGWPLRSLVTVFGLQGALLWLLAAPLVAALHAPGPPQPLLAGIGAVVWCVGMVFEAGGDWQLARFKADPANRGRVLDTGLWGWTRHPNYFGDAACWWGYFLLAAAVGAWWTIFSPVVMTGLLLKVSGVPLLEKGLVETRPGYREYVRRTSPFFPWPPRRPYP